jgi:CRP-like cAMP-binding protein
MGTQHPVPTYVTKDRPLKDHPFITKLKAHAPLDSDDLRALHQVLNRKLTVKKGKDIIVEGYEYKGLDIIETGFAIRYTLLHQGGRQIINIMLPGDIVGFPASFFDRAIFSVMALTQMSVNHISFEAFVDLCRERE